MFDKYIRSLNKKEFDSFLAFTEMSEPTLRNIYMPSEPTRRRAPSPQRMVKIIQWAEKNTPNSGVTENLLVDYFYTSRVRVLLELEKRYGAEKHIGIADVEV